MSACARKGSRSTLDRTREGFFPGNHEILLTGQAQREIPPGGGAFWNRLRDGGRCGAIQDSPRQPGEGSEEFRELGKISLSPGAAGEAGNIADRPLFHAESRISTARSASPEVSPRSGFVNTQRSLPRIGSMASLSSSITTQRPTSG